MQTPLHQPVYLGDVRLYPFNPAETTTAVWEQQISLVGYTAESPQDNHLPLTLYWQAAETPAISYKVFVHLVDENNQVVAQSDTIPQNWTYPTTSWDAGEIVRDPLLLDVSAVPAGRYTIRVGLYDKDTGARLLLQDGSADTADTGMITRE